MKHRLACVDIPQLALQVLLQGQPEWKEQAVVLLDRDEATGRIIDLNPAAGKLGLARGMLYGPCLGLHRQLKGGVLPDELLAARQEMILQCLLAFSPHVERAWFQDGTYWLDATGLATIFTTVKEWLRQIHAAVDGMGFECSLAVGRGRFASYAAARLRPAGLFNIFSGEERESSWLKRVPVELIPINNEALNLFRRLKILTVGDLLRLPLPDIAQRFSADAARMVGFIRDEGAVPLQYAAATPPREWSLRLEEAVSRADELYAIGCSLIDRCLLEAQQKGLQVQGINLGFIGIAAKYEAAIKPAAPTRKRETLARLLKLRIEYLSLESPVEEITCRLQLTETRAPQLELFDASRHRQKREAMAVLRSLQAQRGPESVQFAEILEETLATRRYRLRRWRGVSTRPAGDSSSIPSISGTRRLSRRVVLVPYSLELRPSQMARVVYSGGWWGRPYHYEMGYVRIRGRWHWVQKEADRCWTLVGWVD